jgi:hypothetical protein
MPIQSLRVVTSCLSGNDFVVDSLARPRIQSSLTSASLLAQVWIWALDSIQKQLNGCILKCYKEGFLTHTLKSLLLLNISFFSLYNRVLCNRHIISVHQKVHLFPLISGHSSPSEKEWRLRRSTGKSQWYCVLEMLSPLPNASHGFSLPFDQWVLAPESPRNSHLFWPLLALTTWGQLP